MFKLKNHSFVLRNFGSHENWECYSKIIWNQFLIEISQNVCQKSSNGPHQFWREKIQDLDFWTNQIGSFQDLKIRQTSPWLANTNKPPAGLPPYQNNRYSLYSQPVPIRAIHRRSLNALQIPDQLIMFGLELYILIYSIMNLLL